MLGDCLGGKEGPTWVARSRMTPRKEPGNLTSETVWVGGREKLKLNYFMVETSCLDAQLVKTLFTLIHNKLSWRNWDAASTLHWCFCETNDHCICQSGLCYKLVHSSMNPKKSQLKWRTWFSLRRSSPRICIVHFLPSNTQKAVNFPGMQSLFDTEFDTHFLGWPTWWEVSLGSEKSDFLAYW